MGRLARFARQHQLAAAISPTLAASIFLMATLWTTLSAEPQCSSRAVTPAWVWSKRWTRTRNDFGRTSGLFRNLFVATFASSESWGTTPSEPPFGETWDVMVSNKELYLHEDHWQASFLWGGGFRIFFHPDYVRRFASGDVTWHDEFYGDGGEGGEADGGN